MSSRELSSLIPFLSVVVPVFNEGKVIAGTLSRISEFLEAQKMKAEIIVVDDGSVDGSREAAERMQNAIPRLKVLVHERNRGKGYAVSRGVAEAAGDYVLFLDADLSADITQLERFAGSVEEGYDVVIGSRHVPGAVIHQQQSLARRFAGGVFRWIVHLAVIGDFADLTCGFKLFRTSAAKEIFQRLTVDGWSFDVEVLLLARRGLYNCAEVPVEWRDRKRKKFISPGDLADALAGLVGIAAKRLKGRYRVLK
jgi:dolichyl-phosphate beta-glucosyltransferase